MYWKDSAAVNEQSEAKNGLSLAQKDSTGGSQKSGSTTLDCPLHLIKSPGDEIGRSEPEIHRSVVSPKPIWPSFVGIELEQQLPISGCGTERRVG